MVSGCGDGGGGGQTVSTSVAKTAPIDGTWNHKTNPFINSNGTSLILLEKLNVFDDVDFKNGEVYTHENPTSTLYYSKYGTFTVNGNAVTINITSVLNTNNFGTLFLAQMLTGDVKPWAINPTTYTCNFVINGSTMILTDNAGNTATLTKQP